MKTTTRWMVALLAAVTVAVPVMAQEDAAPEGWKTETEISLNLLQSSYSRNWNGGDKGSVVWAANLNSLAERQLNPDWNWRNSLKLAYGQTHKQERNADGSLYWPRPDKTEDMVELESLLRWTRKDKWDPFVAFKFNTLFEDLSDDQRPISFNPLTFKESAGLSRQFIDQEKRSLIWRIGVAFIQNSRKFYLEPFPSDLTETESSSEVAAEMVTEYKTPLLSERVTWDTKLTLTQPFSYSGKSTFEDGVTSVDPLPEDIADYTTTMDVDWESTFTTNITKVISVKFYVRWVYDKYDNSVEPVIDEDGALINEADVHKAIRKAGQFKQTLALGFGYKF